MHHLKELRPAGGWDRLHLLSHGSDGALQIGNQVLTSRNLWRQREQIQQLGSLLSSDGDLLIYGCELAASPAGERLVNKLADYSGADVAASDNPSGSATLCSRDWRLEYQVGNVNLGGVDLLTGLNWDGKLGGSASYANGVLSISSASDTIAISGSNDYSSGANVMISGLDSPWSRNLAGLSAITIDGDSYTIGGIDLESSSTNSGSSAALPYSVAITGAVTISGDVYTYGGDFSVTVQPRAKAREHDGITIGPDGGVTISTSSLGDAADAMASYGAITLKSQSQAVDVPLDFWFPLTKSTISIGSATGPATSLIGGVVTISSEAILEPWQDSFHVSKLLLPAGNYSTISDAYKSFFSSIFDGVADLAIHVGESLTDKVAAGLQDAILPLSVKTSTAKDAIAVANSIIQANGGSNDLSITSTAKTVLDVEAYTINGANLVGAVTPNWVPNLAATIGLSTATSQVNITASSSLSAAGNVTISSDSTNHLSTKSEVAKYVLTTDGVGGPGFAPNADKPGLAVAVGDTQTESLFQLDPSSTITAGGTVTIGSQATPDTDVEAVSKTYRDGHVTTGVAVGVDHTTSAISIEGSITQGDALGPAAASTGAPLAKSLALPTSGSPLMAPQPSDDFAEPPTALNAVPVANGQSFAVGDRVSFQQLASPADLIASVDADGLVTLENPTGEVLATSAGGSFSVAPGQLLGWTDGTILEYRGSTSRSLGVNEIDLTSPDWQPVTVARPGASYVVTAINGDGSSPSDGSAQLTLAEAAPLQLDGRGATGHQHAIYQVQTVPISASSSGVDLINDELILGGEPSQWPAAGQLVQYYAMDQGGDDDNSAAIGGLSPGGDYFVIPRGSGRIALAISPQEALANQAVDLESIGAGPEHFLRFQQGQTPTVAVTLEPLASGDQVASMATQAQQVLILFGPGDADVDIQTLTLTLLNQAPHSDTQFVSELLTADDVTNPSGLRDRFLNAINATAGLTQGEGAEVGSVAYLTAVASGDYGILLTATSPGVGFGALLTGTSNEDDLVTNLPASLSETVANGEAINGLNWQLAPASGSAAPLHGQMVQWTSGLLQQSDGGLLGAAAFLTAAGQLIGADGASAAQVSLTNGSIVYREQAGPGGAISGAYLRYLGGTGPLDAAGLAASLADASQWLPGAGPLLEVFNPEQSTTSFRLLSSAAAPWQLPGAVLSSLSAAPVLLTLDAPWMSFDPSSAVNATNDSLYLPGLNASTGAVIGYYVDPTPYLDDNSQLLLPVDPTTAVAGSNVWANLSIDPGLQADAPMVNGAPLISARYFSGYQSLLKSGQALPTSSIAQLHQGQTIYLRPSADNNSVQVFTDAAAEQPLLFTTTSATGQDGLLLNTPATQRQNTPVHGLHNGDELQLISLGNDHYQLTQGGIEQARALPQQLLPGQISQQTSLALQTPGSPATPGEAVPSQFQSSTQAAPSASRAAVADGAVSNFQTSPAGTIGTDNTDYSATSASSAAVAGVALNSTIDGRNRAYVLSRSERLPTPYAQDEWVDGFVEKLKAHKDRSTLITGQVGAKLVTALRDKYPNLDKTVQTTNATFGITGAITVNIADQQSIISIGQNAQIDASGDVDINNKVFELYHSAAIGETMLETVKLSAVVAVVESAIDNQATNDIGGTINTPGSVNPVATVVEPNATRFPFISLGSAYSQPTPTDSENKSKRAEETTVKTVAAVAAEGSAIWKNLEDKLFPQLLNSFSNIRNRGHLTELSKVQDTTPAAGEKDRYGNQKLNTKWTRIDNGADLEGDGADLGKEEVFYSPWYRRIIGKKTSAQKIKANPVWKKDENGNPVTTNLAVSFGLSLTANSQQRRRSATNYFTGTINAANLSPLSYDLANDYAGAGVFQFRIGIKNIKDQRKGLDLAKTNLGASKEMFNYGTVSQQGVGAALNVNTSSHQVSNTFASQFIANLSGALNARAERGGLEVMVSLGTGKSEHWGISGALNISSPSSSGALTNTVSNSIEDDATINAYSLSLAAFEGRVDGIQDVDRPYDSKGNQTFRNYRSLKLDVAGDVQNSNSIGIGASFIVNGDS